MNKSELTELLVKKHKHMLQGTVDSAVKTIIDQMVEALTTGGRIEIRGFGSFTLHFRSQRVGRNPKSGDSVELTPRYVPHFKPGKELRDRVNLKHNTPKPNRR